MFDICLQYMMMMIDLLQGNYSSNLYDTYVSLFDHFIIIKRNDTLFKVFMIFLTVKKLIS